MFFYSGGSSWCLLGFLIWSIFEFAILAPFTFIIAYTMILWGIGLDLPTAFKWSVPLAIASSIFSVILGSYLEYQDSKEDN